MIPSNRDAPYSTDEKAWLKKNYGGEYRFLRTLGLSIYKEEDRTEGRSIVRSWMAEDDGEPKGNGLREQVVSRNERGHDNEDKQEGENDNEDDLEYNIEDELEDDPMCHLADSYFSSAELKWIQKHYQFSSKFMLSYGLKPFEHADCDEATPIVRAMLETD
jgi:hypothetical protein